MFLDRALKHPRVRRVDPSSKSKFVHVIQIKHRDEVEAPITDWLLDAYDLAGERPAAVRPDAKTAAKKRPVVRSPPAKGRRK